jgi:hypothetical protein
MKKTALLLLIIILSGTAWSDQQLLVKIPIASQSQAYPLYIYNSVKGLKVRHIAKSFAIAQADESAIKAAHLSYELLDRIRPQFDYFDYYVALIRSPEEAKTAENMGIPLLRFGYSYLFKIDRRLQPLLETSGLKYIPLPEEILPPRAPVYSIRASEPSRHEIINELLTQVDEKRWLQIVTELVDNEDLDVPGNFYRSRFSRRVRRAIQRDGKPLPDEACDNAADYIAQKFKSYGYEVEFDVFSHSVFGEGEYWMRNVVATLLGKGPNRDRIFLVTGHYDSIASHDQGWLFNWRTMPAPGANDNASGIAEILEVARLISQHNFDFTIKFIAFSGEELGLYGSKHYSQKDEQIAGVLNFDQLGYDTDALDIHVLGDANSEWLVNAFKAVWQRYNIKVDLKRVIDPEFIFSDHAPFWTKGYAAVHVSEDSSLKSPAFYPFAHSGQDTVDKVNPALGKEAIKLGLATLAELANLIPQSPNPSDFNPDFMAEPGSLKFSNSSPAKDEVIDISARIKNLGPGMAQDVKYKLVAVLPSGRLETLIEGKANLEVNKPIEVTASSQLKEWGTYKIRAVVNPDFDIFETRFENNIIEKPLIVSSEALKIDGIAIYPNPAIMSESENRQIQIQYFLSKDAEVKIEIFSISGESIFSQEYVRGAQGGKFGLNGKNREIAWRGKNQQGDKISPGIYICRILAKDESGHSQTEYRKIALIK